MLDSRQRASGSRSLSLLFAASVLCGAVTACQVEANANVKSSGSAKESSSSFEESSTTPAPAASSAPAAVADAPPSTPPQGCPLTCYEAQGPVRVSVTPEEQAQLRTALEPSLGKMRACSSPDDWRRRGSPTIHIRVAPDGTLADFGVDPQQDRDTQCFSAATRGENPTVSLPGRKTVRCVERCAPEPREPRAARGPRRRAR